MTTPVTIYLTGDRSMPPVPAVGLVNLVLQKVLQDNPEGVLLVTGDAPSGIERAVRYLVPEMALQVAKRTLNEHGAPDFDASHQELTAEVDKVIVLHADPLNSRLTKSIAKIFAPEKVEYPLDAAINQAPDDLAGLLDEKTDEPVSDEELPPDPFTEEKN